MSDESGIILKRLAQRGIYFEIPMRQHPAMLGDELNDVDKWASEKTDQGFFAESTGARRSNDQCGNESLVRFLGGLSRAASLDVRAGDLDSFESSLLELEQRTESQHFELFWNSAGPNGLDEATIHETADDLETAWERMRKHYTRPPHMPPGHDRIQVLFHSGVFGNGTAYPPNAPIQLNSTVWKQSPGVRRCVAAHELFHKLQIAYGYFNTWTASPRENWFLEGMASWFELFHSGSVSDPNKVSRLFSKPDKELERSGYNAAPFWAFVDTATRASSRFFSAGLLESAHEVRDFPTALAGECRSRWPGDDPLLGAFAAFSQARIQGDWRGEPEQFPEYQQIVDTNGDVITSELDVRVEAIGVGQSFSDTETLGRLSAMYYEIEFTEHLVATVKVSPKSNVRLRIAHRLLGTGVADEFSWVDVSEHFEQFFSLRKSSRLQLIVVGVQQNSKYSVKVSS